MHQTTLNPCLFARKKLLNRFSAYHILGAYAMVKAKTLKIVLDGFGSHLGMEKGCYKVRDKHGNTERYPQFENQIGEVILKSGNTVSVGALASFGFWNIDVLVMTQKGMPVASLRSIDDDSHVETRIKQYQALDNGKGIEIAKQIILGKLKGQNEILRKYGLRQHDLFTVKTRLDEICKHDLVMARKKILALEGHCSDRYYEQIFQLLPETLRIDRRRTKGAYDGVNNIFNLAYTMLKWKVTKAILNAKLELYLGFIHSVKFGKPSLVCDLMELYRVLCDDYVIQFCLKLNERDFTVKTESCSSNRKGKREYLNDKKTMNLMRDLTEYFEKTVDVARIMHGNRHSLKTLISEEVLLLARFLRNERKEWIPRIAVMT
jgi:CRISPR-associated protein Cas1